MNGVCDAKLDEWPGEKFRIPREAPEEISARFRLKSRENIYYNNPVNQLGKQNIFKFQLGYESKNRIHLIALNLASCLFANMFN